MPSLSLRLFDGDVEANHGIHESIDIHDRIYVDVYIYTHTYT
jgi:hypothetical protein